MPLEPQLVDAVAEPTAVIRERTTWADFKGRIRPLFDRVYGSGTKLSGHNVIIYRIVDGGLEMECGVLLASPTALRGELSAGTTPAGRAVTVVHVGPYDRMGEAYDALKPWIEERGGRLGSVF